MNRQELIQKFAETLYGKYNDTGPNRWRTFDGRQVPNFDAVGDQVQAKWCAVSATALVETEIAVHATRRQGVRASFVACVLGVVFGSVCTAIVSWALS